MTQAKIRAAIESALGAVPFDLDHLIASCAAVRDALRPLLPPEAKLEVFANSGSLIVGVNIGQTRHRETFPLI
jgi:hypothetical protein